MSETGRQVVVSDAFDNMRSPVQLLPKPSGLRIRVSVVQAGGSLTSLARRVVVATARYRDVWSTKTLDNAARIAHIGPREERLVFVSGTRIKNPAKGLQ